MKITDVEAIHLRLPQVDEIADGTQDVLIIRIHTDAGLVGIGEVSSQSYVCKAIFEAPPSAVWPWLVQMGFERAGCAHANLGLQRSQAPERRWQLGRSELPGVKLLRHSDHCGRVEQALAQPRLPEAAAARGRVCIVTPIRSWQGEHRNVSEGREQVTVGRFLRILSDKHRRRLGASSDV